MRHSPHKKLLLVVAAVALIAGVGIGAWYYVGSTRTTALFPINSKDTIASWNFKGAYSGNDTLEAQAAKDEAMLRGKLGGGEYDDYDLYIGIGNDQNLLGHGKEAYEAYSTSIAIHPDKGLAYLDVGHLFDELGAYYTAADAYAKAVKVESGNLTYHTERLTFLTRRFPQDSSMIQAALKDASKQFGDTAPILVIEAQWLEGQGRYADAITAWQLAKQLSPGKDTSAIDAQIARDKAKQ